MGIGSGWAPPKKGLPVVGTTCLEILGFRGEEIEEKIGREESKS